jgi:hypothetical protein
MYAIQAQLASRTAQLILTQVTDRLVAIQEVGFYLPYFAARGTYQMHRHSPAGIQGQCPTHAKGFIIGMG